MVLRFLAHVEGVAWGAALKAHERNGACQRTPAELYARHRLARGQLGQRVEHERTDERVTLGGERGLLAVDEKIALLARRKDDALLSEGALGEQREETRCRCSSRRLHAISSSCWSAP